MKHPHPFRTLFFLFTACAAAAADAPRVNGPNLFGVRPGAPVLYTIPATGDRPMQFGVEGLPPGLSLDPSSGRIAGALARMGEYRMVLTATNRLGEAKKPFRIIAGERIALTPPMGWNDWNCWGSTVDQDKILRAAHAMVASGLANHGWTYVNVDDSWQGGRGGKFNAIQPNRRFPDIKAMVDEIHRLGLKAGVYSTPWITSYDFYCGGSSDSPKGGWTPDLAVAKYHRLGRNSLAGNDARQWAAWGFDYLKYDWYRGKIPEISLMSRALRASGRDIVYSLSNSANFPDAANLGRWANAWRTGADLTDRWGDDPTDWQAGLSEAGFAQDKWAPYGGPGHWNDPDMLVVGELGWGAKQHPTRLTPDEQYAHVSLWCLLSAPLMLGCNLERLDGFTLGLLTNDEVLALDQDALGCQATRVATVRGIDVLLKPLEDGSRAIGFFNRDSQTETVRFNKFNYIGVAGRQHVRDLWRHADLPDIDKSITITVPAHGVVMLKLTPAK